MTDMPPSSRTAVNGFPPATTTGRQQPSVPQTRPGPAGRAAPAKTTRRQAQPARRGINLHGEGFLTGVIYVGAFLTASFGGVEVVVPKLALPTVLALPLWLFFEVVGVLFMVIARKQLEAGRKTLAGIAAVISASVAGGVAALNFVGHSGNGWAAAAFSGASVVAYVVFVIQTIAGVLDADLLAGRREARGFRYPMRERWSHPARTRLAAEILARTPDMTPAEARQAATDHPVMLAFIRNRLLKDILTEHGKPDTAQVDGILHVLEPHLLVRMFRDQLAPYRAELVTVMVRELSARSLLGAGAPAQRQRLSAPAVDGRALAAKAAGSGARRSGGVVVHAPTRRTPGETVDAFFAAAATSPGATEAAICTQLGITDGRWRQIKRELRITVDRAPDGVLMKGLGAATDG